MKYRYEDIVIHKTYDADTLTDVTIRLGFKIEYRTKFRLWGINAWELRGEEREKGIEARDYLKERIKGKQVAIETRKDRKGKYGRYLAILFVNDGKEEDPKWTNLNTELVIKGHAKYQDY